MPEDPLPKIVVEEGIGLFKHILLLEALQTPQFHFLQAGAHDGITFDPLRNFAKRFGWTGVVLEPQPTVFANLVANYESCSGVVCLNAALGDEDGRRALYTYEAGPDVPEHATMLASFERDALEYNTHGYDFAIEEVEVETLTLKTILDRHFDRAVDLLQCDTEGFDYNIIKQVIALDDARLPALIRFENSLSEHQLVEVKAALRSKGYKVEAFSEYGAPDVIATRRDFGELEDRKIGVTFAPSKPRRPPPPPTPLERLRQRLSRKR